MEPPMNNIADTLLVAVAGALAAFFFMRFTVFLDRVIEKKRGQLDSLKGLYIYFNDMLDTIGSSRKEIVSFSKTYHRVKDEQRKLITPNRPHLMSFPDSVFSECGNSPFLNEMNSYRAQIRRLTPDIERNWASYDMHSRLALEKDSNFGQYVANFEICVKVSNDIDRALQELYLQTIRMLAYCRILLHESRTLRGRLLSWLVRLRLPSDPEESIILESQAIESEVAQQQETSKAQIERIFGS